MVPPPTSMANLPPITAKSQNSPFPSLVPQLKRDPSVSDVLIHAVALLDLSSTIPLNPLTSTCSPAPPKFKPLPFLPKTRSASERPTKVAFLELILSSEKEFSLSLKSHQASIPSSEDVLQDSSVTELLAIQR